MGGSLRSELLILEYIGITHGFKNLPERSMPTGFGRAKWGLIVDSR